MTKYGTKPRLLWARTGPMSDPKVQQSWAALADYLDTVPADAEDDDVREARQELLNKIKSLHGALGYCMDEHRSTRTGPLLPGTSVQVWSHAKLC